MAMRTKKFHGGIPSHVGEDSSHIQHEFSQTGSIKIPQIKSITTTSIQAMMNKDVWGGEIPRNISKKYTKPIFKYVSDRISNPFLVKGVKVTLDIDEMKMSIEIKWKMKNE